VADVMDVPGVATAERYAETGAAVLAGGEIAPVNLQVFEPGTALHGFDDPLGDGGLVLPATTAEQLGVVAGDRVELRAGAVQAELPLVQVVDEPFGGSGYLSVSAWAAVGGAEPSAIGVILDDRAQHAAVADRLDVLDGSVRVNDIVATGERARQLLAAAAGFAAIILVLAVAMAVALIFNALTVTVGERETEVATLQANGVGRRWIRRAITSENLLAVVAAMIPGLVLGRLSAGWFVGQFSTEQITFDPVLRPWSLVLAVALVIGAALVSQVPGLRRLDRLELAVKVRERAL
jgi:putative ABC transport system permease protein